jgi:tetratricopeptide (TPR) repeat protein
MRKHSLILALMIVVSFVVPSAAFAQSAMLNLPRVSQHARLLQRIGITDISIDYSRPLARDRKIYGGLLTYGKVWRAGANENTTITFSDPISIDGKPLPQGTYGLHFMPGESSWTVIFSRNSTSWGSFTYDPAEDALRIEVKPATVANHEALSYAVDDPTPTSAVVKMQWATVAVPFKVDVNTPQIVEQSLRNQLRGRVQFEWQPWQEAAQYLLDNKLNPDEAAKYADTSIGIEDRFENEITKSRALAALGREQDAVATRRKAFGMGTQDQLQDYGRGLQAQGRYDEALEVFRANVQKNPNTWIAHNELARIAVAKGDFQTAVTEMRVSAAVAPERLKAQISDLVTQLQSHVDINR